MDTNTTFRAILEPRNRTATQSNGSQPAAIAASDDDQEYAAYGHGRIGNRPQMSLAFRKANGSVKAFTYTHLYTVESDDPARGFAATFSGTKVIVTGINLEHLFRLVCQHKAVEIVEASRTECLEDGKDKPLVEAIEFKG